ncbi:UNVERIFIED_CONTAM: hypothetical protein GTU68_041376 [Idotea baltica]|nr:hypothetical protein [Idotea baltica]
MIDSKGENCISVAPGANNELLPKHIAEAESLLEEAEIILLQCEMRPETRDYIIQKGASLGKRVVLNLAPARSIDPERLSELHLLIINESEAEFLSKRSVDSLETAKITVHQLSKKYGIGVILTMGKQGAYYAQGIEGKFVPAFPVEAIDTTAAGDVFCGSLATALVEGLAITEAIRFASAAAAIAVTRLGAQPSAPTREDIDELLQKNR